MVGRLYKRVSGCTFSSAEFTIGEDRFDFKEVEAVADEGDSQFGMLGFAFACIGLLGLFDGEFRAALLAVPIGLGIVFFNRRFGQKTIVIRMKVGREVRYMTHDAELLSFIRDGIAEGLSTKASRTAGSHPRSR